MACATANSRPERDRRDKISDLTTQRGWNGILGSRRLAQLTPRNAPERRPGDVRLAETKKLLDRSRVVSTLRVHLYAALPVGYAIALLAYYLLRGALFQLLPLLFFLGAVPLLVLLGNTRDVARYWTPFVMIMLSYEALSGVVGSFAASRSIVSLYPLDRLLWGLNVTGWVQTAFASVAVTDLSTFFYTLHFLIVVATSVALWCFNRRLFGKFVTAILITSYAALFTFVIMPTMPPWYLGVAKNLYDSTGSSVLPGGLSYFISLFVSDQFAAFPSLHAAYAIIFSYFAIRLDRRLAFVAIPVTAGVLFSTVYLGQHYLIDLIGGAAYALIPCLVSERIHIRVPEGHRSGESAVGRATSKVYSSPTQPVAPLPRLCATREDKAPK